MKNDDLIEKLREAVKDFDDVRGRELAKRALEQGIDPLKMIEEGLAKPVREIGDMFGEGKAFLMDLVGAANVMEAAMEVLLPTLEKSGKRPEALGKVVIGTVEGDIHDIGKNIVIALLKASGFEVIDLGKDVPIERFMEKVKEVKPDIVGASALLTTTILKQAELVNALKREGLRDKVKVLVGGAPCTVEWAKKIGADAYGADANDAVRIAKKLTCGEKHISPASP